MNDFQRYINFIFQPEDIAEMRLINKRTGHISQEWHFAKELPTHLDEWQRFNERGYNIYIGVNPRKEFNETAAVSGSSSAR